MKCRVACVFVAALIATLPAIFISNKPLTAATSTVPPSSSPLTFGQLAQQGQQVYTAQCAICHGSNGQGGAGPALIGAGNSLGKYQNANNLFNFISLNMPLTAPGSLSQEQYWELLSLLVVQNNFVSSQTSFDSNGLTQITWPLISAPSTSTTLPSGNAVTGRGIFMGSVSLANNGIPCISCHNVNGVGALGGGTVGHDLSGEYAKLGNNGLVALLQNIPFPIMKNIYAAHPLTSTEEADLIAFLNQNHTGASNNKIKFATIGVVGLLLLMSLLVLGWRGRISRVRHNLVSGATK